MAACRGPPSWRPAAATLDLHRDPTRVSRQQPRRRPDQSPTPSPAANGPPPPSYRLRRCASSRGARRSCLGYAPSATAARVAKLGAATWSTLTNAAGVMRLVVARVGSACLPQAWSWARSRFNAGSLRVLGRILRATHLAAVGPHDSTCQTTRSCHGLPNAPIETIIQRRASTTLLAKVNWDQHGGSRLSLDAGASYLRVAPHTHAPTRRHNLPSPRKVMFPILCMELHRQPHQRRRVPATNVPNAESPAGS